MGTGDPSSPMRQCLVVKRCLGLHYLVKRLPIPIAMTKFEAGLLTGPRYVLVGPQPIELCGQGVLPNCLKGHGGGVHEQLQCGQSLLAVDDAASGQSPED